MVEVILLSSLQASPIFVALREHGTLRAQGRERTGKAVSTLQAIPTPTHMALAALQERGILKYLISQNCDGLHRKSGVPSVSVHQRQHRIYVAANMSQLQERISELHGNSNREQCKDCGKEYIRGMYSRP